MHSSMLASYLDIKKCWLTVEYLQQLPFVLGKLLQTCKNNNEKAMHLSMQATNVNNRLNSESKNG